MAAASSRLDGTTLTKIFKVDEDLLREKFGLQPYHCYDPRKKDNLVFMSPTVCLEDLELRKGGLKDRGAKEVLGLLAKDILRSKDYSLFQVPEITSFHMGYGKMSENKRTNMAINEFEAKAWMEVFDLASFKAKLSTCPAPNDNNESEIHGEEETPMEVDFEFPKPEDTHALEEEKSEDVINPTDSGLKIEVKPRYLLLFSILMIFYKKKLEGKSSSRNLIGENKISDFLLFWILPYLLYYTEQQVNIVNQHHSAQSREKRIPQFSVPVVQKSAREIIKDALRSCKVTPELHEKLYAKLKLYYGTDQLEHKYNLPAVEVRGKLFHSGKEPIILVPLHYQVTDMPVQIEDIGRRWKEIGQVNLLKQFISTFIDNREIQEDILCKSFKELELKEKCALDYGILLPDEDTFTEFMDMVGEKPDIFREFQCTVLDKQGRDLATPRIGLVRNGENYLSVGFSYFEENDNKKVATLFTVIGSHRVNHFTLALLYGACIDSSDPKMLGCLYPVRSALKFEFKSGKLQKCQMSKEKMEKTGEGFIKGHFNRLEFPVTFQSFLEKVKTDNVIKDVVIKSRGKLDYPKFEHQRPVKVAYTSGSQSERLWAGIAHKQRQKKRQKQKIKMLKKHVKAASLEGCLLYMIARSGPKSNTAVVMGINDTLEPQKESLQPLAEVVRRAIIYFVMAAVVAGLPKVYPPEGNDAERIVESGTDDEDDDEDDNDDDNDDADGGGGGDHEVDSDMVDADSISIDDSGYVGARPSLVVSQPVVASTIKVKKGIPTKEELERLSADIGENWQSLGRRLEIGDALLTGFDRENEVYCEKSYKMLLRWSKRLGRFATYQILYDALCHELVDSQDLAEKFCCEQP